MKFKEDSEAEKIKLSVGVADSESDSVDLAAMPERSGGGGCQPLPANSVAHSLGSESVVPPVDDSVKPEVPTRKKTVRLVIFGLFALLLFSLSYIVITTALVQWKCSMTKHHASPAANGNESQSNVYKVK